MTTSSEVDSGTIPGTDLDGGVTADQSPADDAGVTPGADAGVGTGSLAFTSFLVFLLCLSPFYMLGSNLWDLINGRGEHRAAQRDRGARVSHVVCRLDELLAARGMTLVELSEKVGVTTVNLSVLKNDRAKAIRYSTLCAICEALSCSVGELLEVVPD